MLPPRSGGLCALLRADRAGLWWWRFETMGECLLQVLAVEKAARSHGSGLRHPAAEANERVVLPDTALLLLAFPLMCPECCRRGPVDCVRLLPVQLRLLV
jgi:hypothetical protein